MEFDFEQYFQERKHEAFTAKYRALKARTRWREALQRATAFLFVAIIAVCVLAIVANHISV